MCEMRADIRASGAVEVASTFHVTRTNFPPLLGLYPVPVSPEVELKATHLLTNESNLYYGWKIGDASASHAGIPPSESSVSQSRKHARIFFFLNVLQSV